MKNVKIFLLLLTVLLIFSGCKNNTGADTDMTEAESMAQNTEGGRENYAPPDDAGSPFDSVTSDMSAEDAYYKLCSRDDVLIFRNAVAEVFEFGSEHTRYIQGPWYDFHDAVDKGECSSLYVALYIEEELAKQYGFEGAELIMKTVRYDGAEYSFTERCLKSDRERSGAFSHLRTVACVKPVAVSYTGTRADYCYLTGEEDTSFDEMKQGIAPLYEERDDRFIVFWNYYDICRSSRIDSILTEPHYFEDIDSSLTADEALDRVMRRDTVVFENSKLTAGDMTWKMFLADLNNRSYMGAEVTIAHYYTLDPARVAEEAYEEEKENYPQLFLSVLEYSRENDEYTIETREFREKEFDDSETYKYLKKFEGDLPSGALYKHYTEYILVDDDTLTHEDIERSMYSSDSADFVKSRTVYSNFYD